jgi:hypothetical protein
MIEIKDRSDRLIEEYNKRLIYEDYQKNPAKWYIEKFKEPEVNLFWDRHPGYDGHMWDGTPNPFFRAMQALAQGKDVGIESATGTGKTFIAPRVAFWFLDCFPNSHVICTAPTADQLKEVLFKEITIAFPKFRKLRPTAELFALQMKVDPNLSTGDEDDQNSVKWKITGMVGGKRAGAESSVKFQGHHQRYQLFILEEAAGVDMAVLKAIINTNQTDVKKGVLNLILAIGNPDSQLDTLHTFCQRPNTEHIVISAYDHPNIVTGETKILGAVTQHSIDIRREEYGEDSPFFKSRVRGIAPTEDVNALIKSVMLDKCNRNDKEHYVEISGKQRSYNASGVDVANSVDGDKGCVAHGRGKELLYLREFSCPNANFLAYNLVEPDVDVMKRSEGLKFNYNPVYNIPKIKEFDIMPQNIGVDVVGVGVGTLNTLHELKIKAIGLQGGAYKEAYKLDKEGKPLYEFNGLRAQMYFQAMLDLNDGEIIINIPDKTFKALKRELLMVTYKVSAGKIIILSKEEIKKLLGGKSPNLADAFVYWNWMRHGWYNPRGFMPM